ncbi:MAG: hypothetical protein LBK00_09740 [Treponema sp.]|jgi:hypothetical protein|nr:hypothetical protein [Treponema sp.]
MSEITFDIKKTYAVLSSEKNGWKKELNLVSWNGRQAKFDIRNWSPEHEKMGKGITLTLEEATQLASALTTALGEPPLDEPPLA